MVADLEQPTAGTVLVGGKSPHQARLDQDYGIAFQQAGLLEWRTVAENVELPLHVHGVDKAQRRARAAELLELVGLADFAGLAAEPAVRRHAAAGGDRPRAGRPARSCC